MSDVQEFYSGKNVCDNQDDFNVAFRKALQQNNKDAMKKARPWVYVYLTLWMIFFIWAIVLAMQVPPGPNRIVHLVFAMVASPVYVVGYYLGMLGQGDNVSM